MGGATTAVLPLLVVVETKKSALLFVNWVDFPSAASGRRDNMPSSALFSSSSSFVTVPAGAAIIVVVLSSPTEVVASDFFRDRIPLLICLDGPSSS